MSCCADEKKPRYKGVENFLRKVAFNLGNSPSQSEVKIISCIPIDVTDLQQKIICLERELEVVKASQTQEQPQQEQTVAMMRVPPDIPPPQVQPFEPPPVPAAPDSAYAPPDSAYAPPEKRYAPPEKRYAPPEKRSASPQRGCAPPYTACSMHDTVREESSRFCDGGCMMRIVNNCTEEQNHCACCSRDLTENSDLNLYNQQLETETQCGPHGIFKRSKLKNALKKKGKCKAQFVYYAQTEGSPFSSNQNQKYNKSDFDIKNANMGISRTYLSEMIQKQYAATPIIKEFPISSKISSPICRDVDSELWFQTSPRKNESEICSCLHGNFHNIDSHPINRSHEKKNTQLNCCYSNDSNNTDFYDTSLYDMVPVKEKPIKTPHVMEQETKRMLHMPVINAMYFTGRNRQKYRYHPFYAGDGKTPIIYETKSRTKLNDKKEKLLRMSPISKREQVMKDLERNQYKSCSFDCGSVYVKRIQPSVKPQPATNPVVSDTAVPNPIATVSRKNVECLTNNVKDTDCQTTTSQSVQIEDDLSCDDKKTEDTLNQIKNILQTVLTEVKSNSQEKKVPDEKPTKDAVVQKGMSQSMMPGCSTLLNSYTYSPYNMNPYIAHCSQQIPPGAACYPTMPFVKYLHNYPVFVQNPPRNMCSCYGDVPVTKKETKPKSAATTATNTKAVVKEHNKETHNLIKEIYKSIKVNTAIKDTSASECEGLKSTPQSLDAGKKEENVSKSNIDSIRLVQETSSTPLVSNKLTSNMTTLQSQNISSSDTEKHLRKKRVETYLKNLEAERSRQTKIDEESETSTSSTSEESSDEERSQIVTLKTEVIPKEPQKKPEKKSIFNKMCRLFKSKKSKQKEEQEIQAEIETEEEEESEGESDDYQTIYSQREEARAPRHVSYALHSPKVHSGHRERERYRRTPHMEQQYKQHWNEKQTIHENQPRRTPETRPREKELRFASPTYWQDYDGRSGRVYPQPSHPQPHHDEQPDDAPTPHSPQYCQKRNKGVRLVIPRKSNVPKGAKGLSWIKKHKPACAPYWKEMILDN